ncbi:hypothetical protein SAMN05421781_1734 [Marinococcus luteus]|uniref:Uncharacterized protein n=1 Tax=Marinococcus luteus TaxID=1122204 RepID=A0A1H2UI01_9BACI|nr:hypothetical protein [Marinococcus luteus]SDW55806.1 hypothetical protein SAMN05421781_1734 [Marinococcus luteus]
MFIVFQLILVFPFLLLLFVSLMIGLKEDVHTLTFTRQQAEEDTSGIMFVFHAFEKRIHQWTNSLSSLWQNVVRRLVFLVLALLCAGCIYLILF